MSKKKTMPTITYYKASVLSTEFFIFAAFIEISGVKKAPDLCRTLSKFTLFTLSVHKNFPQTTSSMTDQFY